MSARGASILISADPRGKFMEGVILGALQPGIVCEIETPFYEGGMHRWQPFSATSGHRRLIAVLMEDYTQGKLVTDAYVTGTRGFLYVPVAGEELNMLISDVSGTADSHAVLEQLMVETGTGHLIAESSPESEPFVLLEALAALEADTLAPCMYTGY